MVAGLAVGAAAVVLGAAGSAVAAVAAWEAVARGAVD
jgi:hypothetical protein